MDQATQGVYLFWADKNLKTSMISTRRLLFIKCLEKNSITKR